MSLRPAIKLHSHRGNRLTAAPAVEPVTTAEVKTQLRITGSDDDAYIADQLIPEARQELEDITGIAFITQSWQLTIDRWPAAQEKWWDGVRQLPMSEIYTGNSTASADLPRYPLQSITSVTVYDEDSDATAVTVATTFDIDTQRLPGRITLKRGVTWPVALRANNAIEIVYVAGYGATAVEVPAPLKRAVRQLAAYNYEHRGDECDPKDAYAKSGAKGIMDRYRVVEV
jgi:uncharacterized phiE125 gp8 family phage protein